MRAAGHRAGLALLLTGAVLWAGPAPAKLKLDGARPQADPAPRSGGERITARGPGIACMPYGTGLGRAWSGLPGWGYVVRLGNRYMALPFGEVEGACIPLWIRGPQPPAGTGGGGASGGVPAPPPGREAVDGRAGR